MSRLIIAVFILWSASSYASLNIVLMGANGSGKGTVAAKLKQLYHLPAISSGDIVRDQIARQTEFGLSVVTMMKRGKLLPDTPEFMGKLIGLIRDRIEQPDCQNGFILDGFPRTAYQAKALDAIMKELGRRIDAAVLIDVSKQTVIRRLSERTVCPDCKRSYNKSTLAPKVEMVCDDCGTGLIVRDDDKPETVLARYERYETEIVPVLAFYEQQNQLVRIDGEAGIDAELPRLREFLDQPYPRAYLQERVPKFPNPKKPEIMMYNLVDMAKDVGLMKHLEERMRDVITELNPDHLAAPEARAWPIAGAVQYLTGKPMILIRKAGKIPAGAPRISEPYATAYSEDTIELTDDPELRGKTVVLIDDGLSSGGTIAATVRLLEKAGMNVVRVLVAIQYHYRGPCEEFLARGLSSKTQSFLDLN